MSPYQKNEQYLQQACLQTSLEAHRNLYYIHKIGMGKCINRTSILNFQSCLNPMKEPYVVMVRLTIQQKFLLVSLQFQRCYGGIFEPSYRYTALFLLTKGPLLNQGPRTRNNFLFRNTPTGLPSILLEVMSNGSKIYFLK